MLMPEEANRIDKEYTLCVLQYQEMHNKVYQKCLASRIAWLVGNIHKGGCKTSHVVRMVSF